MTGHDFLNSMSIGVGVFSVALTLSGCSILSFKESDTLYSLGGETPSSFHRKVTLIPKNLVHGSKTAQKSLNFTQSLTDQGQTHLRTYLYKIPMFNVVDDKNDSRTETEYLVDFDIKGFGTRDLHEAQIFNGLSSYRSKVIYARVKLSLIDPITEKTVKSIETKGEYLVLAKDNIAEDQLVKDPVLQDHALDIATREAVRQLESEMVVLAY